MDSPKSQEWMVQNDIKWTVYESGRPTKNETGRLQKCVGGQKRMKVDGTQNCLGNLKKIKVDGERVKNLDLGKVPTQKKNHLIVKIVAEVLKKLRPLS